MKKILTLAIIALTVGAAAFAQDGTVTRRFKVGNFDKLEVSVFNVEVRIGQPTGDVEVTVSEKYADNVDIEVSGRTLNIGFDGIAIKNNYVAKAVVTAPVLCGIDQDRPRRNRPIFGSIPYSPGNHRVGIGKHRHVVRGIGKYHKN